MARKKEYLLVDGYNIIFSWDNLKDIAKYSLEEARIKLIDILCDYKGTSRAEVIIVFDAHRVKKNTGKIENHNNIKVVYTKETETADNFIEKVANGLSKDSIVRVATSDNVEQIIILTHGAYRISAKEFYDEVNNSKIQVREKYILNKPVKGNLLIDNLDEKTAKILEQMRRQKGD